jgi:hypothetical protein
MDAKPRLYWLSSDEVLEYTDDIKQKRCLYDIVDIKTQTYLIFDVKDKPGVKIAWPTINGQIYHTNEIVYFRRDASLQELLVGDDDIKLIFPCLTEDADKVSNQKLFTWYNPSIINYPMRLVLKNDSEQELNSSITSFAKDVVDYDYIIIDDTAYVEYVPSWAGKLVDLIPEHNWEIKLYRISR